MELCLCFECARDLVAGAPTAAEPTWTDPRHGGVSGRVGWRWVVEWWRRRWLCSCCVRRATVRSENDDARVAMESAAAAGERAIRKRSLAAGEWISISSSSLIGGGGTVDSQRGEPHHRGRSDGRPSLPPPPLSWWVEWRRKRLLFLRLCTYYTD